MTLFFTAALISCITFLFVLWVRPPVPSPWPAQASTWLTRAAILAVVLACLLFLLVWVFYYYYFNAWLPRSTTAGYFLFSSDTKAGIFGVLAGMVFGYWLRAIYFREPTAKAGFQEIIAATAAILFLAALGVGEGALQGIIARVSSVKLPGGTELSFSEAQKQNKAVALATTQGQSVPYGAPDMSGGLSI